MTVSRYCRVRVAGLFLFAGIAGAHAAVRPNILLLMAEDMSARVGAFGDPVAATPNLDALAAEGVRFTHTFATAGVCAPSRAAHILGMHQISTGTQHMRSSSRPAGGYRAVPPEGVRAYPELLRGAGYYTYTDGKLDYQFSGALAGSGPTTIWDEEGAIASAWEHRRAGQPFFGFVNFQVTHESGVFRPLGSRPHSAMHFATQLMRWWLFREPVPDTVAPEQVPPYYPDTQVVRADIARHYNNIACMDAEVGAILRRLAADGLADSTVVIWTADHGDGLPRAKRELYDSGIRVPMIIRWPEAYRPAGVEPGQVDSRLISVVDLAPTILSLAGVPLPDYLQGRDFAAASATPRDYVYASRDRIDDLMDRQRAVRDRRFKYLRSWYPGQPGGADLAFRDNLDMARQMRAMYEAGELDAVQRQWYEAPGEERLFDLARDPHEVRDVSRDPAYRAELRRMRAAMDDWLARVGDWSEEPEDDMVERFEPGGKQRTTPPPVPELAGGAVVIRPAGPGHSLEYRRNKGPWQLYVAPLDVQGAQKIEARAVRYGWKESEIVSYP